MADVTSIDDYIATLPEERRAAMELIRQTIKAAAPESTELISYKMPAFRHRGRLLVSYDAYRNHYSLFPASGAVLQALGAELAPYLAMKATIRFPANEPIPTELVTKVVRVRLAEREAR